MSEHTPGPWLLTPQWGVYALDETGNCNRFSVRVEGGWKWRGYSMQASPDDRTPADELEANARLIAAAPELLEALAPFATALSDWGDDSRQPDRWNTWEHPLAIGVTIGDFRRAAAAIAKATQSPTSED